ncbi:hypothetical protein DSO57_1007384 [Entomophthora muscae]|uniref:Uncharacterized protein n=1 Tax=Entomophthora muscae TaxID=34485 RepID=A0ACC2TVW2_9FUNG|nr:hypothetical protein DSO57_1007384 [Entomophthora muscae]
MVFISKFFDSTSNQARSSQASFNGGKAQNVEAPIYTQAFEAALALLLYPPLHKLPVNQPIRMAALIQNNFLPPPNLPPYSQSGFSSPGPAPQTQNHYSQILQEIVALNLQGLSRDQIANQLQFTQATIMQEFNNLMSKGNLIGTAKKSKKAPESQITEAYPIMLVLLQQDPKLPLTQVWKQLAHHGIWVSERMVQLWMHDVRNHTINAISIWPSNNDSCKDLTGFAFKFGHFLFSVNGPGSISTHSGFSYLSVNDPGMTSSQCDFLSHSVFLMSDHVPCLLFK